MAGGITRTINVEGVEVKMRASAALIYQYKINFKKDLLKDVMSLSKSAEQAEQNGEDLNAEELTMFLELAYLMAKNAEPHNPNNKNIDTFLDQFGVFDIYEVLPEIIELWGLNMEQTSKSKKNLNKLTAK